MGAGRFFVARVLPKVAEFFSFGYRVRYQVVQKESDALALLTSTSEVLARYLACMCVQSCDYAVTKSACPALFRVYGRWAGKQVIVSDDNFDADALKTFGVKSMTFIDITPIVYEALAEYYYAIGKYDLVADMRNMATFHYLHASDFTMLRLCFNNDRDNLCEHYDSFEQLRTTFAFKSNVYEADVAEIYTDDAAKLLAFV